MFGLQHFCARHFETIVTVLACQVQHTAWSTLHGTFTKHIDFFFPTSSCKFKPDVLGKVHVPLLKGSGCCHAACIPLRSILREQNLGRCHCVFLEGVGWCHAACISPETNSAHKGLEQSRCVVATLNSAYVLVPSFSTVCRPSRLRVEL